MGGKCLRESGVLLHILNLQQQIVFPYRHISVFTWDTPLPPPQNKTLEEGLHENIHTGCACLWSPLQIANKQTCFCLCVNSLCEQSTGHVLHKDMNSCFILSACAVSDFPHFTGHPAVLLHCTCTLQFVSQRFSKSQNILSAVQRAPHMQKSGLKNWAVLTAL